MPKRAVVIGAGFAGLSSASCLAAEGFDVTILEKNSLPGGRARQLIHGAYSFDMGPSWYWMPDVFDRYFALFGKKTSDYYELIRLDPSYRIVYGPGDALDIPADYQKLKSLLEQLEAGAGVRLDAFLNQAAYKYQVGINDLVYKPSRSLTEFIDLKLLIDVFRMDVFTSFHRHVRKYFKHPRILQLMEFPILFLGAIAQNTPALYSLMNYADIKLGTWYPRGGMYSVVKGMVALAESLGVRFEYDANVTGFGFDGRVITSVQTDRGNYAADVIVGSADYHHIEQSLLPQSLRNYTDSYWQKRVMAPSSLLFYLGFDIKLTGLEHHTLFFDEDFGLHSREIYVDPVWPSRPLFYMSIASRTDAGAAPKNGESVVILIPVAPGLEDSDQKRDYYFDLVMGRLEAFLGSRVRDHIVFKKTYAHRDFQSDYNAFKGNAYGLANTLTQTAILKPSLKSKKIKNLYFAGQLTVPGPGVPPSLISGQVVTREIVKEFT